MPRRRMAQTDLCAVFLPPSPTNAITEEGNAPVESDPGPARRQHNRTADTTNKTAAAAGALRLRAA